MKARCPPLGVSSVEILTMKLDLKTPFKDQKGDTHKHLIVRPSMKVKDTKLARDLSTKEGKIDWEEYAYHLMASMVGLAYEDILELDILDFKRLDAVLDGIQNPKEEGEENPKGSTESVSSTKPSKT